MYSICVITRDGTVYKCYGTNDQVFPDSDLGDKLIGAIVSHNHPIEETSYTFSEPDFELFKKYKLEKLRGCDEMYTYEFTRNADDVDEMPEVWQSIENFYHAWNINKAKEVGIGYRRWKND